MEELKNILNKAIEISRSKQRWEESDFEMQNLCAAERAFELLLESIEDIEKK